MRRGWATVQPTAQSTLTPEERAAEAEDAAEREAAYRRYSSLASAYEKTIEIEDDPVRKEKLAGMLGDLNEENK